MHMSFGASILPLLFIAVNNVRLMIQIQSFFITGSLRLLGRVGGLILASFLRLAAY